MNWDELLIRWDFKNIVVIVINPVREGEIYKKGKITGFKAGLIGGGWKFKKGIRCSYDSSKQKFLKRPKVHVTYNIFDYFGKEHSDWIDVNNVEFLFENPELIEK